MRSKLQRDATIGAFTEPVIWEHQSFVEKVEMREADGVFHVVADNHSGVLMREWSDLLTGLAGDMNPAAVFLTNTEGFRFVSEVSRVSVENFPRRKHGTP